ncbi:MAG TPA: hypothetical protein VIA18_15995 [Polyangia bacterium]|nr:hypothetical protein [Polyangia bacterium]
MTSRLRIGFMATLLAIAGGLACNTPSVPLPPPALDVISFQPGPASDTVFIQALADSRFANARFYVINLTRNQGVITDAAPDGSFTTDPFPGATGDTVEIYYDAQGSGERSENVCTTLQIGAALIGNDCL